jgi:hypothetical protein
MLDSGSSRFQHFSHKKIRRHQSGGQANVAPAWLNTTIKAPHHSAQMVYQEFVRGEHVELLGRLARAIKMTNGVWFSVNLHQCHYQLFLECLQQPPPNFALHIPTVQK